MKFKSERRGTQCFSCGGEGRVLDTKGELSIIDAGQVNEAWRRAVRTGRAREGQEPDFQILICCGGAWAVPK